MLRKTIGKTIQYSVHGSRKVLRKFPRVKKSLKRVLTTQLAFLSPALDTYRHWVYANLPDYIALPRLQEESKNFTYRPRISVIVPTYNTPEGFLRDCFDSVIGQVYENWELCIVDDASPNKRVRELIEEYAARDERIKYSFSKKNQQIAKATNAAVELATGEFMVLFDHDDILWPNALHEVVKALNKDKNLDFIYSDEDKVTDDRFEHIGPLFKPDLNPDFLRSVNIITHMATVRTSLFRKLGGMRSSYDGAQDWDFFLRVFRATKKVHHIPKILYSWRVHDASTAKSSDAKPYVVEAQRKALYEDLKISGYKDAEVLQDPTHKGYWRVKYQLRDDPLVSIVIPSKNQYAIVKRCINSIYEKSTYKNFEIVLVDTGSTEKRVHRWYKKLEKDHENFVLVNWPEKPFSYARSCNEGARVAKGEILIMLNNDTEVMTPGWIEELASQAQRKEIGAAGCLLFYPDKQHIQHAGVGVGLGGVAANSLQMLTLEQPMSITQHLYANTVHNMTAVTAACLAVRKEVFDEVGGFTEEFRITYNDVDLCLKMHDKGYRNLYTPYARLLHHESISVGMPSEVAKRDTKEFQAAKKLFISRWKKYVKHDPALNPNLDKTNAFYDLKPYNHVVETD